MLEIKGLSKTFGGVKAVHNFSFRIEARKGRDVSVPFAGGLFLYNSAMYSILSSLQINSFAK